MIERLPILTRSPRFHRLSRPSALAAAPSQYRWIPLDKRRKEIRLLDLDAGSLHDPTKKSTELSRLDNIQSSKPCGISQEEQDAILKEALSIFQDAARHYTGRRAFITQSGLLGLGPKALQDGDIIAVSKLSLWPMVLRHTEDSGLDHYTVINYAIVEGGRKGEDIFAAAAKAGEVGTIHLI